MPPLAQKIKWTVYGRSLEWDSSTSNRPTVKPEQPLTITEDATTLRIPKTEGPYGEPISTGLAVHLIGNMLDVVNTYTTVLKNLESFIPKFTEKDLDKFVFSPDIMVATLQSIQELIKKSMAITFDKSQILRLISQPGCEGIRFYQAIRKDKESGKDVMTLVCVGLHANAHDLNYSMDKSIPNSDNTCESLVLDWAHPPGSTISDPPDEGTNSASVEATDPMYVLLRMAEAAKYNNNKP